MGRLVDYLSGVGILILSVVSIILWGCTGAGDPAQLVLHGEGVPADSPAILAWATETAEDAGGYRPGTGAEKYTDPDKALGPASGVSTEVLVLGDGGQITLSLGRKIVNTPGYADFAVFENGIVGPETVFGELARVAVASRPGAGDDDFAVFPVKTTRTEPVGSFGQIDPEQYTGFAGIHPAGTGTAFDLQELSDHPRVQDGTVDLDAVIYVRIIDVIGDGREMDDGNPPKPIYDPYPTYDPAIAGNTAGFDLDGVAVLIDP